MCQFVHDATDYILKDQHIVAFGGDAFYTETTNRLSADFLFSLTGKAMPKILFVPTASGDTEDYIAKFHERYTPDICQPSVLRLFLRTVKDLTALALEQDIIYVGGGNTANMLAIWRHHGFDKAITAARDAGVVLCGTSAGSICWFEDSVTDSYTPDLTPLHDGMGFAKGSNCPHYNSEPNRQPQYHRFIAEGMPAGYACDDGAFVHFVDGEFKEALSSRPGARVFHLQKVGDEVVETPVPVRYLGA